MLIVIADLLEFGSIDFDAESGAIIGPEFSVL
jgi:hypothetical protein